jgi:hypothetical protein
MQTLKPLTPSQRDELKRKARFWIIMHPNTTSCNNPICTKHAVCGRYRNLTSGWIEKSGYWFNYPELPTRYSCFLWMMDKEVNKDMDKEEAPKGDKK